MINKKIGLLYNQQQMGDNHSWLLDNSSIESFGSSWNNFGYDIVYRLEEIRASMRIINQIQKAFSIPFDLPSDHFRFEPTFWHVYWDRGQLRVHLLKECEKGLDKIARDNNATVILNDVVIQPRPMGYMNT